MKDVPKYWEKVLQAVVHWIAYKKQYFDGHLLIEGAIVGELSQLLSAKLENGLKLNLEMQYSKVDTKITDSTRCDIAIGRYIGDNFIPEEVVEVKRFEIDKNNNNLNAIEDDYKKLNRLTSMKSKPRLFQLIVGQRSLPHHYFGNTKSKDSKRSVGMKTSNVSMDRMSGIIAKPRMSRQAMNRKGFGAFGILIEINPET